MIIHLEITNVCPFKTCSVFIHINFFMVLPIQVWTQNYSIILNKSLCRCSQTAGRNSCSIVSVDIISQTVRINCRSFLSRVRISIRHATFFISEKHTQKSAKRESPRDCSLEWASDRSRLIASDPPKQRGNCRHG